MQKRTDLSSLVSWHFLVFLLSAFGGSRTHRGQKRCRSFHRFAHTHDTPWRRTAFPSAPCIKAYKRPREHLRTPSTSTQLHQEGTHIEKSDIVQGIYRRKTVERGSLEDNRCIAETKILLYNANGLAFDQLVHFRGVVAQPRLWVRIACLVG